MKQRRPRWRARLAIIPRLLWMDGGAVSGRGWMAHTTPQRVYRTDLAQLSGTRDRQWNGAVRHPFGR